MRDELARTGSSSHRLLALPKCRSHVGVPLSGTNVPEITQDAATIGCAPLKKLPCLRRGKRVLIPNNALVVFAPRDHLSAAAATAAEQGAQR